MHLLVSLRDEGQRVGQLQGQGQDVWCTAIDIRLSHHGYHDYHFVEYVFMSVINGLWQF